MNVIILGRKQHHGGLGVGLSRQNQSTQEGGGPDQGRGDNDQIQEIERKITLNVLDETRENIPVHDVEKALVTDDHDHFRDDPKIEDRRRNVKRSKVLLLNIF